jgi:hypothetical protein
VNPLGWLLQRYTPEVVRQAALAQLLGAAAEAFECDIPPLGGLSSAERLRRFALFTQGHVEELLREGRDLEAVQSRLYHNTYELGRRVGTLLGIRSVRDTMAVSRVLYRILDIEFQGNAGGDVLISRCYFSGFYSAQVCQVMSAMDQGLLAGLSGGGRLVFASRITEGQSCCQASFTLGGDGA